MEIKKLLKEARKKQGLTMKQVAEMVGVSESTISRWESGVIANMTREKIVLLSDALHISPSDIMGWTEEPTEVEQVQDELYEKRKILFDLSAKASAEDIDKFIKMLNEIIDE